MMSSALRPQLVLALAALAASAAQAQTILGGWTSVSPTEADVNLLVQVAGNASYYSADMEPVCLIALEALSTQSVSGTNYKFQVAGCAVDSTDDVGACADRDCDQADYNIVIYEETWTNTLELTSISLVE